MITKRINKTIVGTGCIGKEVTYEALSMFQLKNSLIVSFFDYLNVTLY
jgi:hypothetical protein